MDHDIIIIGAGPAGLSFARAMAETNLNILLIEKQSEEILKSPAYDGREIALTHLSHKIMDELGILDLIDDKDISLIKKAKVLNGNSPYVLSFDHEEVGEETLGYMISNNKIRKAAYESIKGFSNIKIMDETEVANLGSDGEKSWVDLKDGTSLQAPLIIAADSRFSNTRRIMGIQTSMLDLGRTCIVCTMEHELPHDDTAYECFHYDRTLAILPLNNGHVSVVITLKSEDSAELLNMEAQEFADDIASRVDYKFGKLKLSSELHPYPLVVTLANKFYANRFTLIGDAAVGMHPVTAHGFNLGLSGANILSNELKTSINMDAELGSIEALKNYNRKHHRHCAVLYHGTNAIVKLYSNKTRPAKFARKAFLVLGNRIKPVKRLIMNQLTEVS